MHVVTRLFCSVDMFCHFTVRHSCQLVPFQAPLSVTPEKSHCQHGGSLQSIQQPLLLPWLEQLCWDLTLLQAISLQLTISSAHCLHTYVCNDTAHRAVCIMSYHKDLHAKRSTQGATQSFSMFWAQQLPLEMCPCDPSVSLA